MTLIDECLKRSRGVTSGFALFSVEEWLFLKLIISLISIESSSFLLILAIFLKDWSINSTYFFLKRKIGVSSTKKNMTNKITKFGAMIKAQNIILQLENT